MSEELDNIMADLIKREREAHFEILLLKEKQRVIREKIERVMNEHELREFTIGKWSIEFVKQSPRRSFKYDRLKENFPHIYQKMLLNGLIVVKQPKKEYSLRIRELK